MKKMKLIYTPQGKAKEYAELACNIYRGCTHGCRYCYAKRFNPDGYYKAANPKADILDNLRRDIDILLETYQHEPGDIPEILFSFQGDCYQPAEINYRLMPPIIDMLKAHSIPFTILTKGGRMAVRDFELLQGYEYFRFGTTLIFNNQQMADYWEPHAAPVRDRLETIVNAKTLYVLKTWVSLEPVIDPDQALQLIGRLNGYVDFWKIGKINYHPDIEKSVDWVGFRNQAQALLDAQGVQYLFKRSLADL